MYPFVKTRTICGVAFLAVGMMAHQPVRAGTLPVTTGLVLHLDASDPLDNAGTSLPTSGSALSTWHDLADETGQGGDNDMAGGFGSAGTPLWIEDGGAGVLNKPVVRFDGSDGMQQSVAFDSALSDTFTMFLVGKATNGDMTSGSPFFTDGASQPERFTLRVTSNRPEIYRGNPPEERGDTPIATDQFYVYSVISRKGAGSEVYVNGIKDTGIGALDIGSADVSGFTLGTNFVGSGRYLNGDIAEVIVYDAELNTDDRKAVESYLEYVAMLVPGDVNGDGAVDLDDFLVIRQKFLLSVTMREEGDLNQDGIVDFADFREWKVNRDDGVPVPSLSVPEPGGMLLAVLGAAGVLALFRRSRVPNRRWL